MKPQDVRILEAFERGRLPEGKDLQRCIAWIKPRADRAKKRAERKAMRKANPVLAAQDRQKSDHSGILDQADTWYGRFIRMRDTKTSFGGGRYATCCTCPRVFPIAELQCGHWLKRGQQGTRYDEHNTHAQCENCNRPSVGNGRPIIHEAFIAQKYGSHEPNRLRAVAKFHSRRHSDLDLAKIAEKYKAKAIALGWPEDDKYDRSAA